MKSFMPSSPCDSSISTTCVSSAVRTDSNRAPRRRARRAAVHAPVLIQVPRVLDAFTEGEGGLGEHALQALDGQATTGMSAEHVLKALENLERCVDDLTRLRDQIREHVLPRLQTAAPQPAARRARQTVAERVAELAQPRVLHVDTDDDGAATLAALLSTDARVTHVRSLAEARTLLRHQHFELVILDPELPDGDGEQLLPELGSTPLLVHARQHAVATQ